jgi:hypothetical protein
MNAVATVNELPSFPTDLLAKMNITPEAWEAIRAQVRKRESKLPGPGDPAPDFELPLLGGGGSVRLSSFRGERPVALIFGSYT